MTSTTNVGLKKIDGSENWRQIFDYHNDSMDSVDTAISKIISVITGTTNNTGATINSGDYFEANGSMYQAIASIPNGSAWSGSATALTGTAVNALKGDVDSLIKAIRMDVALNAKGEWSAWNNNIGYANYQLIKAFTFSWNNITVIGANDGYWHIKVDDLSNTTINVCLIIVYAPIPSA